MRPKVARCTGAWTIGVAPRAGAWIETFKKWLSKASLSIAPLAGASIETIPPCDWQNAISKSPLVQGVDRNTENEIAERNGESSPSCMGVGRNFFAIFLRP